MITNPKMKEWVENWIKHYAGDIQFKPVYPPGEKNRSFQFVEGIVEMAKFLTANNSNVTVVLQTNDQGVTRLTIDATPQDVPAKPAT